MATQKEGTLQIKDFRGVSRYFASPNNPPNKLYAIQNMYSPNRGELAYLPGSTLTDMSADGFTNLIYASRIGSNFLVFSRQSRSDLPTPNIDADGWGFAPNGAVATTVNVKMTYGGLGYETVFSPAKSTSFGVGGIIVNVPNTIPRKICLVNFYREVTVAGLKSYTWVASCCRDDSGNFPANLNLINCTIAGDAGSAGATGAIDPPTAVTFLPTTGGTLIPGQTYYFGFAPGAYFNQSNSYGTYVSAPRVSTTLASGGAPFAYTIPPGYNAVQVNVQVSGLYDGVHSYTYLHVLMGTSSEGMVSVATEFSPSPSPYREVTQQPAALSEINGASFSIIKHMPNGSNNGVICNNGGWTPAATRDLCFAYARDWASNSWTTPANPVACVKLGASSAVYSSATASQILPIRGQYLSDGAGAVTTGFTAASDGVTNALLAENLPQQNFVSAAYNEKLFISNGVNVPNYTDGFIISRLTQDNTTSGNPVTTSCAVFKGRLIFGGGKNNPSYTAGTVVYSEANNPFAFSVPSGTTNFFLCRSSNVSNILGFGVTSYNLSTGGQTNQLCIGLDDGIWLTPDVTGSPQEVAKNVGFISPYAFINSNVGAFFVGRDNVYMILDSGKPVPRGNDVAAIVKAMQKVNRQPLVIFHQGHLKLLYNSSGSSPYPYDTELWCDLQLEPTDDGEAPRYVWTGPHTKDTTRFQCVMPVSTVASQLDDFRIGMTQTDLVNPDAVGKTSYNGAAVQRKIIFNDLYLSADQFMKVLTRLYIGAKYQAVSSLSVPVTITFSMTDQNPNKIASGSGDLTSFTDTLTLTFDGQPQYKLNQKIFAARYRGRVVSSLTLTWNGGSLEETMSIYDLSVLFLPTRRRTL